MSNLTLKLTLRRLRKEKVYAAMNIIGLSLAIACCLIILSFVRSELAYDTHHENHERIVRITNEMTTNGQASMYALTSRALGPLLENAYPHLGEFARFRNLQVDRNVLRTDDVELYWDDVLLADENVFDVFTHEVVYGDIAGALTDPSSIAVSETFAKAYFGDMNPIGETVSTDTFSYKISLVFKDLPQNSHVRYDALLSMNRLRDFGLSDDNVSPQQLFGVDTYTYFMLDEGVDLNTFAVTLDEFYNNIANRIGEQANTSIRYIVQPLTDVHFDNDFTYDQPTGNIFYVFGFIAIGIFLITVACINYTNLATARAVRRAKEVGMCKIIGAEKDQLIVQHLGESIGFALFALVLGLIMVFLIDALTPLKYLLGKASLLDIGADPLILVVAFLGSIFIGVLAGAYPAFYLSSVSPLAAITAHRSASNSRLNLSEVLVFLQFLVSISVVIATILMALQMQYIANKPLGFDRDNKVVVTLRSVEVLRKMEVIKNELLSHSAISGVAQSSYVPGVDVNATLRQVETEAGNMEITSVNRILAGDDFVKVMNIEVLEGRDFSKRFLTDIGTSVLVNETLVAKMGWEDPIGKRILPGNSRVVGVIRDFHFESLHQPVNPMILRPFPPNSLDNVPLVQQNLISRAVIINIDPNNAAQALNHIESVITQFDPEHPFEYEYFTELLDSFYADETNQIKLLGIFSLICILISCMGLAGLAAFTAEKRTKEIGIRKVLGASTEDIIRMIAGGFITLIATASVFAGLISYLVMDSWLSAFAYRADIAIWVFIVSPLLIAAFAFTTIAIQSWKTAKANPVEALRYV